MKIKYHINPETGNTSQCTATVRDCAYAVNGQIPEHYNNEQEARKASEEMLAKRYGEISLKKKKESIKLETERKSVAMSSKSTEVKALLCNQWRSSRRWVRERNHERKPLFDFEF